MLKSTTDIIDCPRGRLIKIVKSFNPTLIKLPISCIKPIIYCRIKIKCGNKFICWLTSFFHQYFCSRNNIPPLVQITDVLIHYTGHTVWSRSDIYEFHLQYELRHSLLWITQDLLSLYHCLNSVKKHKSTDRKIIPDWNQTINYEHITTFFKYWCQKSWNLFPAPTSFFQLRARKCSATCAGRTFSSKTLLRFSIVSISSHSFLNLFFHRKSNLQ